MTDANPFDDLSEVENDGAGQESSESSSNDSAHSSDDSTRPSDSTRSESTHSGPAFEYQDVRQRPLYARGETWDEFEDAIGISVVPELRRQGIRDEEKREIHDAVLTLAVEDPDRLVELIVDRRENP